MFTLLFFYIYLLIIKYIQDHLIHMLFHMECLPGMHSSLHYLMTQEKLQDWFVKLNRERIQFLFY